MYPAHTALSTFIAAVGASGDLQAGGAAGAEPADAVNRVPTRNGRCNQD
jgi:hypothetical protein